MGKTMSETLSNYYKLTKPSIMILVLAAGATAIFMEGSLLADPWKLLLFMACLYLTGGSANALNQYFERDIDAKMTRTCSRRPLPKKQIESSHALVFSIAIGVIGVAVLAVAFNLLTALLAAGTILFYGLFYTLWLKPRTSQNIVIGGVAGAMAPVGAWTAATGTMNLAPWFIFLIIFFWTPPHFWSLALKFKDDYDKAELPMMPNKRGDSFTLNSILYYTLILVGVSLLPLLINFSWVYLLTALILGSIFIQKSVMARKVRTNENYWGLFRYSILYLFIILLVLAFDGLLGGGL